MKEGESESESKLCLVEEGMYVVYEEVEGEGRMELLCLAFFTSSLLDTIF